MGDSEVHGKGLLGGYKFSGGDHYSRKSFADPDLVGDYWIHAGTPPKNRVRSFLIDLTNCRYIGAK